MNYMHRPLSDAPTLFPSLRLQADEAQMATRMELMGALATDLREAFEFGFTPDPSIVVMLAMDAATSFAGMGPSMMRRVKLLGAILAIAGIEEGSLFLSHYSTYKAYYYF